MHVIVSLQTHCIPAKTPVSYITQNAQIARVVPLTIIVTKKNYNYLQWVWPCAAKPLLLESCDLSASSEGWRPHTPLRQDPALPWQLVIGANCRE